MAFNPTPSAHIAGITVTSNNLVIPLTSIPELTQAEVVDATGDIRKVAYALTQKLHSVYQNIPAEDRPTRWSVVRNTSAGEDSPTALRAITATFTINNPLNSAAETEVVSEE